MITRKYWPILAFILFILIGCGSDSENADINKEEEPTLAGEWSLSGYSSYVHVKEFSGNITTGFTIIEKGLISSSAILSIFENPNTMTSIGNIVVHEKIDKYESTPVQNEHIYNSTIERTENLFNAESWTRELNEIIINETSTYSIISLSETQLILMNNIDDMLIGINGHQNMKGHQTWTFER